MPGKPHARGLPGFLPCSRDCVHVTQAISERSHHVRGKVRRLLNEKMEPSSVDFSQATRAFATAVAMRRRQDQCHLPNQCARRFRPKSPSKISFPLQFHASCRPYRLPGKGNRRARLQRVGFLAKKLGGIHECNIIGDRD
jgi:hypothetical protein